MKRLAVPVEQLSSETRQLADVINNESDLACVTIGAAFLDAALATLLERRFLESKTSAKLLSPSGALGGFAQRADVAYCLELVTKSQFQDLCKIAEIRNRFAHHHLQLTFNEDDVRALCGELLQWRVLPNAEDGEERELSREELRLVARNQFNISVILLANRLILNALGLKKATA